MPMVAVRQCSTHCCQFSVRLGNWQVYNDGGLVGTLERPLHINVSVLICVFPLSLIEKKRLFCLPFVPSSQLITLFVCKRRCSHVSAWL